MLQSHIQYVAFKATPLMLDRQQGLIRCTELQTPQWGLVSQQQQLEASH